jgi:hypothetical protein
MSYNLWRLLVISIVLVIPRTGGPSTEPAARGRRQREYMNDLIYCHHCEKMQPINLKQIDYNKDQDYEVVSEEGTCPCGGMIQVVREYFQKRQCRRSKSKGSSDA